MQAIVQKLAQELGQKEIYVENVIRLLDEGNTVPFIARYRKEMHGTMDDQTIRLLSERLTYLRNLQARRDEVKAAIAAQEKLTEPLAQSIDSAQTLAEIEDLYRPYRPKRRTRASIAREKGLEPLAQQLREQKGNVIPILQQAAAFINEEKGVCTAQEALDGAQDILAEQLSDDAEVRSKLRALLFRTGILTTIGDDADDRTYEMYHTFSEPVHRIQSHRILAINRGEKEGKLKVSIQGDENQAQVILRRALIHPKSAHQEVLRAVCMDSYNRLIFPSLEREIRNELTDRANEQAIHTFALNLRPLLMQPPVKGKVVLGFDPAYRTGCKLAIVDEIGKVLKTAVIYPTPPHKKIEESKKILQQLCQTYGVQCIAIGNGTASKESETFVADCIRTLGGKIQYMVVSEAGASVYSASKLGAEEFPEYDVSLRSAVSIARRLQDPLAELVKIDPKAIGVGQYQHDMPQARLGEALDGVVEDCVSSVGVDLNTASAALLARVAGVSKAVSKNIITYREQNGRFQQRKELLKVKGLGPKAYEQCAGFLRVLDGKELLDRTAVHPESYQAARTALLLCGYTEDDAANGNVSELSKRFESLNAQDVAQRCGVGVPTLHDIITELQKPGRDPREELPPPMLRTDVLELSDLKTGMELTGTVRNVTDFGAFVDIGVHQDGLVHISELSNRFIKHPSEAVQVGDIVQVRVLSVDEKTKRIALSMKQVSK
nr:Tex family protein [uncultured Butyricicoccus sp.]